MSGSFFTDAFSSSLARSAWVEISDESQVGHARRTAASLANGLGFDPTRAGELAIVVTEAAENILRHAGRGTIILQPLTDGDAAGIDVIAVNGGPGIENLAKSLKDGVSTAGSPGNGLGAIRRLSAEFDIHTDREKGTVVFARIWNSPNPREPFRFAATSLALPGEEISGDGWALAKVPGGFSAFVCDGLGHGPEANEATRLGIEAFRSHSARPVLEIAEAVHRAMRPSRGGAVAIARVEPAEKTINFVGVGNLSAIVIRSDRAQGLISHGGIMGHEVSRMKQSTAAWEPRSVLVVHSDGLQTHSSSEWAQGLITRHPAVLVGALLRDFSRGRDDATVFAVEDVFA